MANNSVKKLSRIIDGTQEGYEELIADDPNQFLEGDDKPLPDPHVEANAAVSSLPDQNGSLLTESAIMVKGGVRVRYVHIPSFMFNMALGTFKQRMQEMKPKHQTFIADSEGTQVPGHQNDAFIEALAIWQKEWDNITELVSSSVSLFSGLELIDGMPEDSRWLPRLEQLFALAGLDFNTAFDSVLFDKDKIKQLYFKQYIVLGKAQDMAEFTRFQETGDLSKLEASEAKAAGMFRTNEGDDSVK